MADGAVVGVAVSDEDRHCIRCGCDYWIDYSEHWVIACDDDGDEYEDVDHCCSPCCNEPLVAGRVVDCGGSHCHH